MLDEKTLATVLLYALERGITFWDTALMYDTLRHVGRALRHIARDRVVLATKLTSTTAKGAQRDFELSLKTLGTEYVDICLIHGVRNKSDFRGRRDALNALVKYKQQGAIRIIGLSAHGIEALEAAEQTPEMEVVWARTNYAGLLMDTRTLGLYDTLASIGWVKRLVKLMPRGVVGPIRPDPVTKPVSGENRREVARILQRLHAKGKGVVGMKVMAEGSLAHDPKKAIEYVVRLPYSDAFVIGMLDKREVDENCRIVESIGEAQMRSWRG